MIDEHLRQIIRDSGLTHYRIAVDAGVATAMIDRFMSGERDLRFASAAKVAKALGIERLPAEKKTSRKTRVSH